MPPGPIPPTPHRPGRRHATFSPTQLRVFRDCPERYYRQYIGNEKVRAEFNPATLRGSAVHKVLARVFIARQDGEIIDDDLRSLAEQFLPRRLYQDAGMLGEWPSDIDEVLGLVEAVIARVAHDSTVLNVETSFMTICSTSSPVAGVTLVGKVDLLIRDNRGFLEQIEFKTGGAQPDPYQEVICRMGVCAEHNASGLPVLSTTVQLSTGAEYPLDSDRRLLTLVLTEIEETILQVWSAMEWPAQENDRCRFCNYRTTLCSRFGEWSHHNRLAERGVDGNP